MSEREATCRCGLLRVKCTGEPIRVSVCHCLECQRRSGSAFAAQARWNDDHVTITGNYSSWTRYGDNGAATFCFCPECGATPFFTNAALPGQTAVAIGAFADPTFPAPAFSVYENRKHAWVAILGDVEHD